MFMITMFDTAFKSTETGKTDVGLKYNSTRQWLVHWKTFVWCRYCYVSWKTCKGWWPLVWTAKNSSLQASKSC